MDKFTKFVPASTQIPKGKVAIAIAKNKEHYLLSIFIRDQNKNTRPYKLSDLFSLDQGVCIFT
jgi:hypothetical protein